MDNNSRILSSRAGQRPMTSRPLTGATRPLTSTGLIAPRTSRGKSGIRRQIQDKSYYISLLRSKINELSAEISTLSKECDSMTNEEARVGVYHRKAETLAKDLADMTNELGIYNEFNDRLRLKEDENEIKEDIKSLKVQNEELMERLETSYEKKKKREEMTVYNENELKLIQNNWINLKRQFTTDDNKTFESLEKTNEELRLKCESLETEINVWKDKRNEIEVNSNSDSLIRREILQSVARLRDLETQRNHLVSESSNSGDERGRLLAQVKRDNNEIALMESRITAIKDQINEINGELESYEDVGATLKYKELKKKEQSIEQFLEEFDSNRNEELSKIESSGEEINEMMAKLSRCLTHIESLKGNTLKDRDSEGTDKNRPMSGKQSIESLKDERRKLELDLNKIEQLEGKVGSEMETLKAKMKGLESDIEKYSDIPKLKEEIEKKLSKLEKEKQKLIESTSELEKTYQTLKSQMNTLQTSIDNNDINKKLRILETKLQDILSTNETIKASINVGVNTNLKLQVFDEIKKYNQKLLGY